MKGFKTATDTYKVKGNNGELVSLKEYDPEGSVEIDAIQEATKGHFLFYSKIQEEHPTIQKLIQPQSMAA